MLKLRFLRWSIPIRFFLTLRSSLSMAFSKGADEGQQDVEIKFHSFILYVP